MRWKPGMNLSLRRRARIWCIGLMAFAVLLSSVPVVCTGAEPETDRLWVSRRLVVRGQEPEPVETRSEELFAEHIETDRDSFTPSTRTVDRGRWVVESSYSFIDNRDTAETHSLPELLLRYGIADWIELRLGGNYEVGGEEAGVSMGGGSHLSEPGGIVHETQALYGVKLQLSEQESWLPDSSLIVQGHAPLSGPDPATAFTMGYVAGWELPDEWKLDSSIRFSADKVNTDRFETWSPSVVLRKSPAERWNIHAEYFGHFSQNREDNFAKQFISPGVHYLVTPNVELGVRIGWGLNDEAAKFFSNVGIGWRF